MTGDRVADPGTSPAVEGIRIVGRCGECGLATDRLPCPHCELEARQIAVIKGLDR